MVPRKPHPFGMEWNDICCALCGIIYCMELREGKDAPENGPVDPRDAKGKTVGLLLRLCKNIYASGKIVILDSGFSVLAALVELKKMGVYASAVAKKRRYWPKYVPGAAMEKYMKDKAVGSCHVLKGVLEGVKYKILSLREPDYYMKLMAAYGAVIENVKYRTNHRTYKDSNGDIVSTSFNYSQVFANHFLYRHLIDDHNNLRHMVPSIEGTWKTHNWIICVLTVILTVSEVNAYLAFRYFHWTKIVAAPSLHHYCRKLALMLMKQGKICQDSTSSSRKKRKVNMGICELVSAPPHAKAFINGKWNCTAKNKYQKYKCTYPGCNKTHPYTRKYCTCSVGEWICLQCYPCHIIKQKQSNAS